MIELRDIHKSFGTVQALQGVFLQAAPGTIHGIVGENGAGKSTLMKILTGFISSSQGEISINGRLLQVKDPGEASARGIGMLYQEPLDFLQLSVLDNFMVGRTDFSPRRERQKLTELCKDFGFELHPETVVEDLTIGERQQLELLRLIRNGVKTLILDEPTTGISELQKELLFHALTTLKESGATLLLVSHKLDEIDLLCDRVTVLRNGRVAATQDHPFNRTALLEAMFDSLPEKQQRHLSTPKKEPILECRELFSATGRSGLNRVTTTVHQGEVVGLAGVDGSGQSLFLKIACGLLQPVSGEVLRFGKPLLPGSRSGGRDTVFLPADRLTEGLFGGLSIREHRLLAHGKTTLITSASGLKDTREAIHTYNIKGRPDTDIEELSGGNQQRVLLSLIPEEVKLILMENPTRGLDVHSAAWSWNYLHEHLAEDGAIVFASPDLEELMEQSSRILVFYNGSIVLDTPTRETSYQQLSRAITGQGTNPVQ